LVPVKITTRHRDGRGGSGEQILLSVGGGAAGFGSGCSGAGGPLFSVPLMVILGYAPLAAVATSQVLQIIAAISGSLGNLRHGFIDWRIAALITVFELAGLVIGVRLAHVACALVLRRLAGERWWLFTARRSDTERLQGISRTRSGEYAIAALQGPASARILARLIDPERLRTLRYFRFVEVGSMLVARLGYSGELGYEL